MKERGSFEGSQICNDIIPLQPLLSIHTHTHTHTHTQLLEARVAALAQQQQRKSERENKMKKKSEVSGKISQCCLESCE